MTSTTIKLLTQDPGLKRFSGDDISHSALSFIESCEDAFRNSSITTDEDKIAFVRSQLVTDSLAADMMRATCFSPKHLSYDYSKFRDNFIRTFGHTQIYDSLQWIFRYADSLTSSLGSFDYLRSQAKSADIANEAIDSLTKASWLVDGALPVERLRKLLEIMTYIPFLVPHERRVASSLDFKPNEELIDFSAKLRKKLRESPTVVAPAAPIQATTSRVSEPAEVSHMPTCSFCLKTGHTSARCFKRKRAAREAVTKDAYPPNTNTYTEHYTHKLTRQPARPQPLRSSPRPQVFQAASGDIKYCHLHGNNGTHSTDECRNILRLKRSPPAAKTTDFHQSGEALRHSQKTPP